MIVAIHQPNYIPWLGYFNKVAQSDVFVFLDDAQYTKNSFINRNRIKTPQGEQWLTIPACTAGRFGSAIREMRTDTRQKWPEKHLNTLVTNYRRAPHFDEVMEVLAPIYRSASGDDRHPQPAGETPALHPDDGPKLVTLATFNIALISAICLYLELAPTVFRSSEMRVQGQGTERLVEIVRSVGGTEYLSGSGGQNYQDEQAFAAKNIKLRYSDFESLKYPQLWGDFVGGLSVVDALMNLGRDARRLLVRQEA